MLLAAYSCNKSADDGIIGCLQPMSRDLTEQHTYIADIFTNQSAIPGEIESSWIKVVTLVEVSFMYVFIYEYVYVCSSVLIRNLQIIITNFDHKTCQHFRR